MSSEVNGCLMLKIFSAAHFASISKKGEVIEPMSCRYSCGKEKERMKSKIKAKKNLNTIFVAADQATILFSSVCLNITHKYINNPALISQIAFNLVSMKKIILPLSFFLTVNVYSQTLRIAHRSHSGKNKTFKIIKGETNLGESNLGNPYPTNYDYGNLNKTPNNENFLKDTLHLTDSLTSTGDTLKNYLKNFKKQNGINHIILKDSLKQEASIRDADKNIAETSAINVNARDAQPREGKNGLKWLLTLIIFIVAPLTLLFTAKKITEKKNEL